MDGHYFVGEMPPPSIVAFPTTAVVDLETMVVIDRDMHSTGDSLTIEDVLAAVHAANDD